MCLCEKPIGLTAGEAATLIAVRDRTGVKIQEAFMVRTHPQWLKAIEICRSGELGELRSFLGYFSFYNDDPANVRHVPEFGGGALMDIGCYLVLTSRLLFGEEPRRVLALMAHDPAFKVDTTTSMILDYPSGQAVGTCSMRAVPYQRVQMFGTRRRLEIEIPFNAPPDRACRLWIDDGRDLLGGGRQEMFVDVCDQYLLQGDAFSRAILDGTDEPYPLESSLQNMRIIDALVRSSDTGAWETICEHRGGQSLMRHHARIVDCRRRHVAGRRSSGAPRRQLSSRTGGPAASSGSISGRLVGLEGQPVRKGTGPRRALRQADDADSHQRRRRSVYADGRAARRVHAVGHPVGLSRHRLRRPAAGPDFTRHGRSASSPSQKIADITLRMMRGSVITGTVIDEFGDPAYNVPVRAMRFYYDNGHRALTAGGNGTTDDRGVYRIAGLPAG